MKAFVLTNRAVHPSPGCHRHLGQKYGVVVEISAGVGGCEICFPSITYAEDRKLCNVPCVISNKCNCFHTMTNIGPQASGTEKYISPL